MTQFIVDFERAPVEAQVAMSVHASAMVATPAAFANRGVFVHASSLTSV